MMDSLFLEIITPERQFYIGPAEELVIPSIDGLYGIQPGHEPAVTAMEPGELRYRVNGQWHTAAIGQGFVEIMPERAIVLVSTAEKPDEIDAKRAQQAKERAEERIRQQKSVEEYYQSKAALARAMARLKVKGRR